MFQIGRYAWLRASHLRACCRLSDAMLAAGWPPLPRCPRPLSLVPPSGGCAAVEGAARQSTDADGS